MEIFLASLAIFSGWLIYRLNIISEYEKINNSLQAILNVSGEWFSASYPRDLNRKDWLNPKKAVYKVDSSILPNIITSNVVSKELVSKLGYFIQLISRFNHEVDKYNSFKYSDINLFMKYCSFYNNHLKKLEDFAEYRCFVKQKKKEIEENMKKTEKLIEDSEKNNDENLKNKSEKLRIESEELSVMINFSEQYYDRQKSIHTSGIGVMNNFDNSNFPQTNKCFHDIKCLLEKEKYNEKGLFKDASRYIFGDIFFLIIPGTIILFSLIKFYFIFNSCIKCFLEKII